MTIERLDSDKRFGHYLQPNASFLARHADGVPQQLNPAPVHA